MSAFDPAAAQGVVRILARRAAQAPAGLTCAVISFGPDEGASPCARAIALEFAARSEEAALLIDLDLRRDGQFAWFDAAADRGEIERGPLKDARFGEAAFFRLFDAGGAAVPVPPGILAMRQFGPNRLYVTQFRPTIAEPGLRAQVVGAPYYWTAARNRAALTVVDCPPLSESRAGLAIAPQMDAIVLVIGAATTPDQARALKEAVEERGGAILGLVVTDADPVAERLDRALGGWLS